MSDPLKGLEAESVKILRHVYLHLKHLNPVMLWSVGKDSTVLLYLTRRAFGGFVPWPLLHINTGFKPPELISYRNEIAALWELCLYELVPKEALGAKKTFPDGNLSRTQCCQKLKTEPLLSLHQGVEANHFIKGVFTGQVLLPPSALILAGIRSDEEGSRSKERIFSKRDSDGAWKIGFQGPEISAYYPEKSQNPLRVHPLLNWTEKDIWAYIAQENLPICPLYKAQNGQRYRSLGCYPCTKPHASNAVSVQEIMQELHSGSLADVPERSGREQDKEDRSTLETLRRKGYM